jgi:HEPN domain-containing protein
MKLLLKILLINNININPQTHDLRPRSKNLRLANQLKIRKKNKYNQLVRKRLLFWTYLR